MSFQIKIIHKKIKKLVKIKKNKEIPSRPNEKEKLIKEDPNAYVTTFEK
jgi:hypothetical protein